MFTGIVQGLGEITAITQNHPDFRTHTVRLPGGCGDLQTGASVAHNGCCLTVTRVHGDCADFDLMGATLVATNLGSLKVGDAVNIERAARFGDEIGGHIMSGHIIATTTVSRVVEDGPNLTLWLRLPENLGDYILPKGFVGLDGCSLTIGSVEAGTFCVHLIPETRQRTLFGRRRPGDVVNVEIDAQTQAVVDTVRRVLAQQTERQHG